MNLKIALLQLLPGKDPDEQLKIGIQACRKAKEIGADIALFPEMWNTGYVIPQDEKELKTKAVSDKDAFIGSFRRIAQELKMAVGITFLEQNEPKPLNSVILFDRNGEQKLHYSKVHICAFADEIVLFVGNIVKVILYGSYARGDYNEHSDIDLMFLTTIPEDEIRNEKNKLYDLAFDYEMDYGVDISVTVKNIMDYQYWLGEFPFYDNIEREGVVVHG